MEKNYYDILQINKNASPEIVEKAYKTLVRMYHPDLQENINKQEFEEKLKLINEAYEVLSNEEKRKQYDFEIQQKEIEKEQKDSINNKSNNQFNGHLNNTYDSTIQYNNESYEHNDQNSNYNIENEQIQSECEEEYQEKINEAIEKAYHDAYIQSLKDRGYTIIYKKTFKDYIKNFIIIIIFMLILILLWNIPFIRNYFINIYNENEIIQYIVNLFINFNN